MAATKKRTEVLVGLFLLLGFAVLGGLILQFGRLSEHLRGQYFLTVVFDDASGVIQGSEVRMGGARIGQVAELPALTETVQVEVRLAIREEIRIPAGSAFQINSATLLGDKLIVIVPPVDRSLGFIAPGGRLTGSGATGLDALQSSAANVGRDVERMLKQAEQTLTKVDGAVSEIQTASKHFGEAVGKINRTVLAEKNLTQLETTIQNLATTSQEWKSASAKLEPTLVEARQAIESVRNAADQAGRTLKSADQAIAGVKPALEKLPKAVDSFSATTQKAGDALDRMKRGEGLLGALASDNDVALDAKAFMKNLRRHGIIRYRDSLNAVEEKSPFHFGTANR